MKYPKPIVYVVDDDDAVRTAIRLLLQSVRLSVTLFASPEEFLAAYDDEQPGCLLLDVRMPAMNGLELQQRLNRRGAIIPVIFISGHADVPMAVEAMQHGAFDFLTKPFREEDLLDRVRHAFERDAADRRRLSEIGQVRVRFDSLSAREREVLQLVADGKLNKVIAAALGVSQRTVEVHRARVMEKMEARSLAQLVRMVMELERHPAHSPGAPGEVARSDRPGTSAIGQDALHVPGVQPHQTLPGRADSHYPPPISGICASSRCTAPVQRRLAWQR